MRAANYTGEAAEDIDATEFFCYFPDSRPDAVRILHVHPPCEHFSPRKVILQSLDLFGRSTRVDIKKRYS